MRFANPPPKGASLSGCVDFLDPDVLVQPLARSGFLAANVPQRISFRLTQRRSSMERRAASSAHSTAHA
jgi:hypothetical protein